MVGSIAPFIILLLLCFILPTFLQYLVGNYYLAQMLTSIILAFVYAAIRNGGLRSITTKEFWKSFFIWGIVLMLLNMLMFLIMAAI